MSPGRVGAALARKELRELGPIWLVTMCGLACVLISHHLTLFLLWGAPATVLAALAPFALGAMSVGHEFRHGTLSSLLTQPASRVEILVVKAAVLVALLAALALVASLLGVPPRWLWIAPACGLCLAPFFTMVSRSELAGMAFAGAVPAIVLLTGEFVAQVVHGPSLDRRAAADALSRTIFVWTTSAFCIAGLVGAVVRFLTLQVVDGNGHPDVARVSRRLESTVPVTHRIGRRRGAYAQLLLKELRLQLLPIGLGVAFVALLLVGSVLPTRLDPYGILERLGVAAQPMVAVLLATLAGAVASADERHLGIWSSQMLVPVPAWKPWFVKVGVVLGLALAFGFLLSDAPAPFWRFRRVILRVDMPLLTAGAAALALYVSSLSTRGLTAFLVSAGVVAATLAGSVLLFGAVGWPAYFGARGVTENLVAPQMISLRVARSVATLVTVGTFLAALALIARFALSNHRAERPDRRRVVAHAVAIAGVFFGALLVSQAGEGFTDGVFRQNRVERLSNVPLRSP